MRVLIVDDETYLAEAVAHVLKRNGYNVDIAPDGEVGLKYARDAVYDVIVLDVMMPKLDGISVMRALRKDGNKTPVIMLSAKGETEDKIDGLDSGADDYLAKPFKTAELLARIRALSRRKTYQGVRMIVPMGNASLRYDTRSINVGEKVTPLTAKEFAMAEALATQDGNLINKEVLFKRIWGQDMFHEGKYVEVYVSFLRKKLSEIGANVTIQAVRGMGYRIVPKVAKEQLA
jgi:two-component system, OmpR family, response regulator ArlR